MNYSSKNTISQQKADGPSDFLGITQSSGLVNQDSYEVDNSALMAQKPIWQTVYDMAS